jgi:subtilisin family serine protease
MSSSLQTLGNRTALKSSSIASISEFGPDKWHIASIIQQSDAVRIDELDVLVVKDPQTLQGLSPASVGSGPMPMLSPERIVYPASLGISASAGGPSSDQFKQLLEDLIDVLKKFGAEPGKPATAGAGLSPAALIQDTSTTTWGLQAVQTLSSSFTGKGVRVAIIDTGIDTNHPDFVNRAAGLSTQSFVNESVLDVQGHGTHVAGTACGKRSGPMIYGVAPDAGLFIAKVFPQFGGASDADVISAIRWAIQNNCQIANLSLSAPVAQGEAFSDAMEQVAKNALQSGLLLVAASGNESGIRDAAGNFVGRQNPPAPVGHPANCPSILAVGALTQDLTVAPYSNGGQSNPANGQVNFAAPGDFVVSSWPTGFTLPKRGYNIDSGTSMAAPHVTGLLALLSESLGGVGGLQLWQAAGLGNIKNLPGLLPRDVGLGMLLAP